MSWVFDNSEQKLGSLLVLLVIANHAKSNGADAWPSTSTIAREARLSETQTHRCIRKLLRSGELGVEVAAGPRGTNLYFLAKMGQLRLNGTPCQIGTPAIRGTQMAPEPSLTVQSQNLNLRRPTPPPSSIPCGNVEKRTPQQKRFAVVGQLAAAAAETLRKDPGIDLGDLSENLKGLAARASLPYFDALPGVATPIQQAITIAIERRKSCARASLSR